VGGRCLRGAKLPCAHPKRITRSSMPTDSGGVSTGGQVPRLLESGGHALTLRGCRDARGYGVRTSRPRPHGPLCATNESDDEVNTTHQKLFTC